MKGRAGDLRADGETTYKAQKEGLNRQAHEGVASTATVARGSYVVITAGKARIGSAGGLRFLLVGYDDGGLRGGGIG